MPPIDKPDVCSRCHKNAKAEEMGYCGRCIAEVIENRVKRKLGALATGKIVIACSNNAFSQESKNQAINLFESITEKELELYAAIKKIKYTKGKNTDLRQKIQKLQSRYPGTIEALAQSSRRVGEL